MNLHKAGIRNPPAASRGRMLDQLEITWRRRKFFTGVPRVSA